MRPTDTTRVTRYGTTVETRTVNGLTMLRVTPPARDARDRIDTLIATLGALAVIAVGAMRIAGWLT